MFRFYYATDLEKQITTIYQSIGIVTVKDLNEEFISSRIGIKLLYVNEVVSQAFEKGKFRCIVLDNRLSAKKQRKAFYHELGHLLRGHVGDQASNMPDLFRGLQEEQADQFALYAAMPMYLIQQLNIPEYEREIPKLLSEEFIVPIEFANNRWEQIKRRIYCGRSNHATIQIKLSRQRKSAYFQEVITQ